MHVTVIRPLLTWFLSDSSLSFSRLSDSCWAGDELARSFLSWVTRVLFIRSTSLVYSSLKVRKCQLSLSF